MFTNWNYTSFTISSVVILVGRYFKFWSRGRAPIWRGGANSNRIMASNQSFPSPTFAIFWICYLSLLLLVLATGNGNRTEWGWIRSLIIQINGQRESGLSRVWLQTVLDDTSINHKNCNFRERNSQVMKERENLYWNTVNGGVNCFMLVCKLRLFNLNYNFEGDWLIELYAKNCPTTTLQVD